jgi:ribosomal protein L21E
MQFRQKGMIKLSTYLRQYKVGDIVDIKANGAVQKGSVATSLKHLSAKPNKKRI